MAALATRAEIARHQDDSLMPLPLTGETATQVETWVTAIMDGAQTATLVWDTERLLGAGYECERPLRTTVEGQPGQWTERVQVVRSRALAQRQQATLAKPLAAAEAELWALTPAPGRGKQQSREESVLQAAIASVLERHGVTGLLPGRGTRPPQRATWAAGEVGPTVPRAPRGRSATSSPACTGTRRRLPPGSIGWADASRSPMRRPTGCRCQRPSCTIGEAGRRHGTSISSKTSRWA